MNESAHPLWHFDNDSLCASDGMPARRQGEYAQRKFEFLDPYVRAGLTLTKRLPARIFLDLFAGPGLNRTREGTEFPGSPLRVLRAVSQGKDARPFDRYIGINKDPQDYRALQLRVAEARRQGFVQARHVDLLPGDANALVGDVLSSMPQGAWVFAYADIERPSHLPWTTVKMLASRERRVDLYVLFPLNMGYQRMAANETENAPAFKRAFGDSESQAVLGPGRTPGERHAGRARLLSRYLERLRGLWTYADVMKDVALRGEQRLYRMLLATNNAKAFEVANHIKLRPPGGQAELGF